MQSVKGRKIVLIGGAGFIGHHLALALAEEEGEVSVIDSLQVNNLLTFSSADHDGIDRELYLSMLNRRLELLREARIPLYIQDARDYHLLSRQLGQIKPQVVVHLAAVAHAGKSNKDPYSTFDHSLRTLENALDYARGGNVEQFIYFSSSMVYGDFPGSIVTEESLCEPLGIYGALKFSGEKMVTAYHQVFGLPYTIVRPSALYGPRCVSRRVVQVFIESALRREDIVIEGDGSDKLDFTYIDDVVGGVMRIMTHGKATNQIFNLTYGQARSIGELAELVKEYFAGIKVAYVPKDRLVPDRGTLDVEKARRLLGYEPQYSLEAGLKDYIGWYQAVERRQYERAGATR